MYKYGVYKFFIVVVILLCRILPVFSQILPQIINPSPDPRPYCRDSVRVAPEINISDLTINNLDEGIKISIINYSEDEDVLVFDKVAGLN